MNACDRMQRGSQFRSRPFSGTLGSLRHMYPIAYVLCSVSELDEPRVVCFICESIFESAVTQVENNFLVQISPESSHEE